MLVVAKVTIYNVSVDIGKNCEMARISENIRGPSKAMKKISVEIRQPGNATKLFKEIEKVISQKKEVIIRKRAIQAAHLIRDSIAENAPRQLYTNILLGEPLERFYNRNSGYDVSLSSGAQFHFSLKLSTHRFSKGTYQGWNPIYGLLNSNYGRKQISSPDGIPVAVYGGYRSRSKTKYNHPAYRFGHKGRYRGSVVVFPKTVREVSGTHWIEAAIDNSRGKINRILAGKLEYTKQKQKSRYWG